MKLPMHKSPWPDKSPAPIARKPPPTANTSFHPLLRRLPFVFQNDRDSRIITLRMTLGRNFLIRAVWTIGHVALGYFILGYLMASVFQHPTKRRIVLASA